MKIIDIEYSNDVIQIQFEYNEQINNVDEMVLLIDECSNVSNVGSNNVEEHDYTLTLDNSVFNMVYYGKINNIHRYVITVEQEIISELDEHLKHFTLKINDQTATFVYYDARAIYKAQMNKLKCVCNTCLDDRTMQKIMVVTFKQQLLEQSICIAHYVDAMNHYLDLCRMLDIQIIKYNKSEVSKCDCCVCCDKCTGEICKLK